MTTQPETPSRTPHAHRVFQGHRLWRLSANGCRGAAALIADAEQPYAPDLVLGIARGGVPVARMISELMHLPYQVITARHNADDRIQVQATGHVTVDSADLPSAWTGKRILLVDDICGTGATIEAIRTVLDTRVLPASLRTAVLCRNVGSPVCPDSWVWEVADWTVFPWEADPDLPTEPLPAPVRVRHP